MPVETATEPYKLTTFYGNNLTLGLLLKDRPREEPLGGEASY